jgi:hypothetical protein
MILQNAVDVLHHDVELVIACSWLSPTLAREMRSAALRLYLQNAAPQAVLEQAELLCADWTS